MSAENPHAKRVMELSDECRDICEDIGSFFSVHSHNAETDGDEIDQDWVRDVQSILDQLKSINGPWKSSY